MNLTHLSDQKLLDTTDKHVKKERHTVSFLLHCFLEIDRRRLMTDFKCGSIFEFLVKRYKYSEQEAYRRMAAMNMLRTLPEIENKVESGTFTLTHLNLAASLFREEEYTKEEKLEVLDKLENTSTKDAEKVINEHSIKPKKKRKERIKELGEDEFELLTHIDKETRDILKKLKGLIAHTRPKITVGELLKMLAEETLKKWDPGQQKSRVSKSKETNLKLTKTAGLRTADGQTNKPPEKIIDIEKTSRQIPASVQREVWKRASSTCENCGSVHALQIDHRVPVALGGSDELSNLRLICRKCNQRAAIKVFGLTKMQGHIENGKT